MRNARWASPCFSLHGCPYKEKDCLIQCRWDLARCQMENRQDCIMLWCWMSLRRCWAFHNAGIKQDSVINRENFAFHHMHLTSRYKHTSVRFTPMLDTL